MQFNNHWFARYSRPIHCIHDQGGKFTGFPFQNMLLRHNIRSHTTTAKNPKVNSVCEQMHQTISNSMRVLSTLQPPQGIETAYQLVDTAIANAVFAHRSTFSSAHNSTPGGLAFQRDMILDLPLIADFQIIREKRQQFTDQRPVAANRKRFSYDYTIGDVCEAQP